MCAYDGFLQVESSTRHWRRPYSWGRNTRICQRIQTLVELNGIVLDSGFLLFIGIPLNSSKIYYTIFLIFLMISIKCFSHKTKAWLLHSHENINLENIQDLSCNFQVVPIISPQIPSGILSVNVLRSFPGIPSDWDHLRNPLSANTRLVFGRADPTTNQILPDTSCKWT